MKVTVTLNDEIFILETSEDLKLKDFRALCEVETGSLLEGMIIVFNGTPLVENNKTLKELGVEEGDMLLCMILNSPKNVNLQDKSGLSALVNLDFSSIQVPHKATTSSASQVIGNPRIIRDMILASPENLALLKQINPRLVDSILSDNLDSIVAVLMAQIPVEQLNTPLDAEAQKLIAEEIRQSNIEANLEVAIEFNPETFGTVVMLYINCTVNGVSVKAFIDSGAQTTIMSQACAERCNIMRLVDSRFSGIAKGVGTQKIIGRIHMVQMKIEQDFLTTSFYVLAEQPMDMLFGLDMLKRHRCTIDLKKNVLHIGSTGTETPFLAEADLLDCARLSGTFKEGAINELNSEHEQKLMKDTLERSKQEKSDQSKSTENDYIVITDHDMNTIVLPTDRFTETDIKELVTLGFTRDQVIMELRRCNGDKTKASAVLYFNLLNN